MTVHLTGNRSGFGPGLTEITRLDDREDNTGIALSVLKLERGERFSETASGETAWLLMEGEAIIEAAGEEHAIKRASLFDDLPYCMHVARGAEVSIEALGAVELTVYRTANRKGFPARVFEPSTIRVDARGKGLVRNASFRFVRTIFDPTNAGADAELVLGEVVNLPGRWSSYPPHHHPQPEMYHYRFTKPQGYGHAELGETVFKVRQNDTIKIFDGQDHPQCAAPGYGMYYSWVIRHLPGRRYDVPEFSEEHAWVMRPGADHWWPRGIADDGQS